VSFADYRDEILDAYRKFQAKYPKTDEAAYNKACKLILDFCESVDKQVDISEESKKSTVARMQSVKQKFTDLVCPCLDYVSNKYI
jgi:hypothetical protein